MPAKNIKSRTANKKQGFKFKPWMAFVIIGVVLVAGFAIYRFSRAGAGNSEAELDRYFVYQNGYTAKVSLDNSFLYKTYRKNPNYVACYFAPRTQEAVNAWNRYFSPSYKQTNPNNQNYTIQLGRWYPTKKCI